MSRSRGRWNQKPRPPYHPPLKKVTYNLDRFTIYDIAQGKERQKAFSLAYWNRESEFAYQRSLIKDEIKKILIAAAISPFPFSKFQRGVKYRWALDPLSVEGSLKDIGGRFNIGDIDRGAFPMFPALYLGEDKNTVLQEMFQCPPEGIEGLTSHELALTNSDSIAIVSVYGSLETIIDLYEPQRLQGFVDLIKNFEISSATKTKLKKIGDDSRKVTTIEELLSAVYEPNWRSMPMQLDLPSPSQIFGQLVSEAGIEGIRYKSKFTDKSCLAIFPHNLLGLDSFIEIMDPCPPEVKQRRLEKKLHLELTNRSRKSDNIKLTRKSHNIILSF